jgi:2-polyprenyl-3-methyl-5-hydroxy-6-metoxy-1,4-benzoquinol methylase
MSMLTRWARTREAKRWGYHTERPEDLWRRLIAEHARGRSFLDVGCMWQVNGEYAFLAAECGATAVTGVDVSAVTTEFVARNERLGNPVRFVKADLNDPGMDRLVGTFDVVFCSGVLYHVPNPVRSLEQLRRLCTGTLILTTASLPEGDVPNTAILLAGMDDAAREAISYRTRHRKLGLDSRFVPVGGYANWVWLPTPSCVRSMVGLAGFTVEEFYPTRRVTTLVANVGDPVRWA